MQCAKARKIGRSSHDENSGLSYQALAAIEKTGTIGSGSYFASTLHGSRIGLGSR